MDNALAVLVMVVIGFFAAVQLEKNEIRNQEVTHVGNEFR